MDVAELCDLLVAYPGTRLLEAGGDFFAVHDPDGDLPPTRQRPWATIVTSNAYDDGSDLDRPGIYCLNFGLPPDLAAVADPNAALSSLDVLRPHPDYGRLGFVCVLNPTTTWPPVRELLDTAHTHATADTRPMILSGWLDCQVCLTLGGGMTTPNLLDRDLTLRTAVARYDDLRLRDSLADPDDPGGAAPLARAEALELLALGELISRKAIAGRQLTVRTARAGGASWAQIGQALGTTRQAAWEAHTRWIDSQIERRNETTQLGFDDTAATQARALAGSPDDDGPD